MVGVKDHPEGLDINDPLNYGQLHRIEMGLEGHVRRDQFHLYDRNGIAGTVKPKEDDYYFDDLNIDDNDDEVDDNWAQELSKTVPLIPGNDRFNSTGWDMTPRFNADDDQLLPFAATQKYCLLFLQIKIQQIDHHVPTYLRRRSIIHTFANT